ncbi:MAG: hypothetical protein WBE26_09795 [Phycisphaerae bacterium]
MGKKNATKRRITAPEAARAAAEYYQHVTGNWQQRPTLEEIELNEDQSRWLVTLGVYSEDAPFGERAYKRFEVDVYTGEVLSMKIRKV